MRRGGEAGRHDRRGGARVRRRGVRARVGPRRGGLAPRPHWRLATRDGAGRSRARPAARPPLGAGVDRPAPSSTTRSATCSSRSSTCRGSPTSCSPESASGLSASEPSPARTPSSSAPAAAGGRREEWLRDALAATRPGPALVDAIVTALVDLDETELAARLPTAAGRYEEAVPLVGRLASDGLAAGRAAWSRALIEEIPDAAPAVRGAPPRRDPPTDSWAGPMRSAGSLRSRLVSPTSSRSRAGTAPARGSTPEALLADHYRMAGDPRALAVCEQALGDALIAPTESLATRWSAEDVPAAAEMLRYFGFELMLHRTLATMERGRQLLAAAMHVLETWAADDLAAGVVAVLRGPDVPPPSRRRGRDRPPRRPPPRRRRSHLGVDASRRSRPPWSTSPASRRADTRSS